MNASDTFEIIPATAPVYVSGHDVFAANGALATEMWTDAATYAKWIREDLKAVAKACPGLFGGVKVSVRCSKYSMGQSVTITLTPEWSTINEAWVLAQGRDRSTFCKLPRHNARTKRLIRLTKMIASLYHRDQSDAQTDYYHVNFALSVDIALDCDTRDDDAVWAEHDRAATVRVAEVALNAVESAGLLTDDRPALALDALRDGDMAEGARLAGECARGVVASDATALLADAILRAATRGFVTYGEGTPAMQRFARVLALCGEARDAAWHRVNELAA